jgi:hypothetical protein
MLDACVNVIQREPETTHTLFENCFRKARDVVVASTRQDSEEPATGSLFIGCVDGDRWSASWVGPDEAWLLKGTAVIAKTIGHVLDPPGTNTGGIVTRVLGQGFPDPNPQHLEGNWRLDPSDRVALISRSIARTASTVHATTSDPQRMAEQLADSVDLGRYAYAAAIVLRAG